MEIKRSGSQPSAKGPAEYFTGVVRVDPLFQAPNPARVSGAQACALIPGASRNGMTLAAARWRGFGREDANELSRHVALPVIVGATVLKGVRLAGRGLPRGMTARFALGIGASFVSTLASSWLIHQVERDRSLAPYAAYRTALALAVLAGTRRVRDNPAR